MVTDITHQGSKSVINKYHESLYKYNFSSKNGVKFLVAYFNIALCAIVQLEILIFSQLH